MIDKKVILVTGANKGIGFEIVRQLADRSCSVILTSRNEAKGLAAQAQLKKENLLVDYMQLDISREESIREVFNKVKSGFGKLDVLINNAAILLKDDQSLLKNDLSILKQNVDSNSYSHLMVTMIFSPIISTGGRVIMTSSQGGRYE
jgi:NAD(P)-dependent dehydrogenase (short-subunit alcohol dehydrogenase family)